ncbi:hypothetical protein JG688_00011256 [Phytophthora aleatoria]|uniref:Uncharacterized protein n=1 Tax=Phytophthora aleatoria TaxID=2496075 RepID=A0A8J5IH39_9STRA|nr:hypothetical protein JG688_00011256 [Phytophthora aleatoria]
MCFTSTLALFVAAFIVSAMNFTDAEDAALSYNTPKASDLVDSSDAMRKLYALKGGALRLELAVTIRVLRSTWVAKYVFDLDSDSVERIDVLESKLRDQQDELEKLRGELKSGKAPPFIKLTASTKHGSSILCWDPVQSDECVSSGLDGKIKVRRGGVYNVGAIVTTVPGTSLYAQLLKNGTVIQVVYPGYYQGYYLSAILNTMEHLEGNDELTITFTCNLAETSYLTFVRMGS